MDLLLIQVLLAILLPVYSMMKNTEKTRGKTRIPSSQPKRKKIRMTTMLKSVSNIYHAILPDRSWLKVASSNMKTTKR